MRTGLTRRMKEQQTGGMKSVMSAIDNALMLRIEEIEGRVPTDREYMDCLMSGMYGNGIGEYRWKGEVILRTFAQPRGENEIEFQIDVVRQVGGGLN